jgi:hypothetical protein
MRKNLFSITLLFATLTGFGQLHPTSIVTGTLTGVTKELRSLPVTPPGSDPKEDDAPDMHRVRHIVNNPNQITKDGSLQTSANTNGPLNITAPVLTFDGQSAAEACGCLPPDPNMCVGPNHVVQMVNLRHSVYTKTGVRLSGPTSFSTIAPGATNDGDPIVLYDQMADRWILMQFSNLGTANDRLIFCVSTTPDPAGTYYVYSFLTSNAFPDYPHVGIWTNAYTVTADEYNNAGNTYLGKGFYALDRNKMLAGQSTALLVRFKDPLDAGNLPASLEGLKMPDPTALPMFWTFNSDEYGAAADMLEYRTMNVDFNNPASSTLSANTVINTASFDGRWPQASWNAIEEQGTSSGLDAIADRMMSRVVYRRFDDHESLVMNYTVNVSGVNPTNSGTYQGAVRWYELRRNNPASPWAIYQQSTYAPYGANNGATGTNGWMSAIDMDQKGSIGMAYSRSSTTTYPDIYYAQRLTTDPLNTLGAEQVFYASGGSQTSTSYRWGDYAAMACDPTGDTLWFTGEYYGATSGSSWKTRIGKFVIAAPVTTAVHFRQAGTVGKITDATTLVPGSTCLRYKDYPINIDIDQAPSQPVTVTLTTSGNAVLGVDYDLIYTSPITLSSGNLTKPITIRVYDNTQGRPDQYIYISYTLNVNGGNAVPAFYNQIHQVTIFGKPGINLATYSANSYGVAANVFTENFDALATGVLPQGGWTEQLVAGTANTNHFMVGANGGTGFTSKSLYVTNNASAYAYNASTSASMTLRAASPNIDITGKGSVAVTFTYKSNGETSGYDYGSFWYSADGGATWNTDGVMFIAQTTAVSRTVNLPLTIENIPNLKIGFQWQNDNAIQNAPPMGVDLITVTAKPIIYNAQIQSALNLGSAQTYNFGPNQTTYFVDTVTKKIMASITNNSAFNFGCTKVYVDRSGTGAVAFNSNVVAEYLASKTFKVLPENTDPTASYTIRLYYTEAEIAGWEAATGNIRSGMKVVKVSGSPNGVSDVTPANQASYNYVITPGTAGTFGADGVTYEATFSGFSGFGVGKPVNIVLPITLLQFRGEYVKGQGNKLTWVVTNQMNVKQYELEFSKDGSMFSSIANVGARPFNGSNLSYDNLHRNYINGTNYYRLKTIDNDGRISYSAIVLINVNDKGSVVIYPNPVNDQLTLNYRGASKNIKLEIIDAAGKLMYSKGTAVTNPIIVPVSNLSNGTYILRITDGENVINTKFVKQ